MTDLDKTKRAVSESSELSKKGEHRAALRLLDEAITDAILTVDDASIRILTRHAAVISEHIGDLDLSRRYTEQSLPHSSEDPFTWYSLANNLLRQGKGNLARQYAAKSYTLSLKRGREEDKQLAQTIKKRWPDIIATK